MISIILEDGGNIIVNNRKITFIIGNRAHYARVKPILKFLSPSNYRLVLFESAVLSEFGNINHEINKYVGKPNIKEIFTNISGSNLVSMTKSTGISIIELSSEFTEHRPDIIVIIADRYETLAAAIAARYMNIPVAHIQGGEVSGSIDESIRHSITKLANIHFVTNKDCAERIKRMGEYESDIYITGCPTIDLCTHLPNKDIKLIFDEYTDINRKKVVFRDKYIIVAFHPVTTEYNKNKEKFSLLLKAINKINIPTIWLCPNIDAGNDLIGEEINHYNKNKLYFDTNSIYFFKHFAIEDYLTILKNSACIAGNSSVGIRESSFFGTPSVSIGTRQKMRMRAGNVVDAGMDEADIYNKILGQISQGRYASSDLYGIGNAGENIAKILMNCKLCIDKQMTY